MKYFLLFFLLLINSCDYSLNQGKQTIKFESRQTNVNMILNGDKIGQLPISRKLSRCYDHNIIFEKSGYEELNINIGRKQSIWLIFLSVFMFGPIGGAVDNGLCALDSFDKSQYRINLYKE